MIDVIIPVYQPNQPEVLNRCIESVLKNTPDCNLIISSSDKTQPININRGLKRAKSKYIAILDWDVIVPDGWTRLIEGLKDFGIVGAKMQGEYTGLNCQAPNGFTEWSTLAGGCMVFKNIGLRWDEDFPSGQWADTDFCRQYREKGYKIGICGDVVVDHSVVSSKGNPLNQGWQSQGREVYIKKWGDDKF